MWTDTIQTDVDRHNTDRRKQHDKLLWTDTKTDRRKRKNQTQI